MRATRRDTNAQEQIDYARVLGMFVTVIEQPLDLLVGYQGVWFLAEQKGAKGRYTKQQTEFMDICEDRRLPVVTWRTLEDVEAMKTCIDQWGNIAGML